VALDRQSVEKKDFPIGRRGYEPEAVDAHLARLAAEIEDLQRQAAQAPRASGESLAIAASEQVRAIVEAAESSAADIERTARDDADRIRSEAQAGAAQTRDDAIGRSQEHVAKVSEASSLMLQRVDAMENELGALMESLRTGANRLNADLSLLQGNMGELYGAAGGRVEGAPAAPAAPVEPVLDEVFVAEVVEVEVEPEPPAAAPEPEFESEPAPEPAAAVPSGGGDVEGARLVALNMALNGQSRDETDRYLAENFDLDDRQALLDEVYATVEG
jgi:DivIVA domain-containing protein